MAKLMTAIKNRHPGMPATPASLAVAKRKTKGAIGSQHGTVTNQDESPIETAQETVPEAPKKRRGMFGMGMEIAKQMQAKRKRTT